MSTLSHIPTSFVPLPPQTTSKKHWRLDFSGAISFVSFGIFVIVSLVAAGMFLYQMYLQRNLGVVQERVHTAEKYLNAESIRKITNLNNQLIVSRKLLGTHITMSRFLDLLSTNTPRGVRISSLNIHMNLRDKKETALVKFTGEARNFNDLVIESQLLKKNKNLSDIVFSSIVIDNNTNEVKFSVSTTASKSLIENFSSVVSGVGIAPQKQISAMSTTKVSTTTP